MRARMLRTAAIVLTVGLVTACAGAPATPKRSEVDSAFGAIARGDFITARRDVADALARNPNDPYARLAAAVVDQNTGEPDRARALYRELIRENPDHPLVVDLQAGPRTIAEVAKANLSALPPPGTTEPAAPPAAMAPTEGLGGSPAGPDPTGIAQDAPATATVTSAPLPPALADAADRNRLTRFETLARLLQEGLIPPPEAKRRHDANIGAILTLTAPPPAAGLGQPLPPPSQIADRLKALETYHREGSIPDADFAAERATILNSLLPETVQAPAPRPPVTAGILARRKQLLDAARAAGIVTPEEYGRESLALAAAQVAVSQAKGGVIAQADLPPPPPPPAPPPKPKPKPKPRPKPKPKPKPVVAPKPEPPEQTGLQLASYRDMIAAEKGWYRLKHDNFDVLGTLDHHIYKVELPGKGTFYRLKVGPALNGATAKEICRILTLRKVACALSDPTKP